MDDPSDHTQTPLDVKAPMIAGYFIDDLGHDTQIVWIPADNFIIFATRHEQVTIVGRPL